MAYDLVIKNGIVVDGSGLPGFKGDVAIAGGKIAAVGNVGPTSARTLDARGRVVLRAPGGSRRRPRFLGTVS